MKSAANNKRCPQCQGQYMHVMPLTNLCDTFGGKDEQVKMLRDITRNDNLKNTLEENNRILEENNHVLEANYNVQFEMYNNEPEYNQHGDIIIGNAIDINTYRPEVLLWMNNGMHINAMHNTIYQNSSHSHTLWDDVKRFLRRYFYTL